MFILTYAYKKYKCYIDNMYHVLFVSHTKQQMYYNR
jgi:hypothetical protein